MTIHDKLRYYPKEGDIILYLDGKSFEVVKIKAQYVKLLETGTDTATPLRPIAHIRSDMVADRCFLCRKEKS